MPETTRQLAAIMFTDIVGYTSLMSENEQLAISIVNRHQEVLEKTVAAHLGKVFQYFGDGSLSIFNSATEAVHCAMEIQIELRNELKVPLRIGIHIGEILIGKSKVFGDGVNLASRIESLGQAGTVMYSLDVYQKIKNNPLFNSTSLGNFNFKNVSLPMEVFALSNDGFPVPRRNEISGKTKAPERSGKYWSRKAIGLYMLFAVLVIVGIWMIGAMNFNIGQGPDKTVEDEHSIMVLPFDNYSEMPDQQYFANGIADELRSQLLSIKNLRVISRSSSNYYKEKQVSLKQLANDLKVEYVLEGTVQRSNDLVKVNVQLSNTKTEQVEWASPSFQEKLEDIFILQNKISQQIVGQLKIGFSSQNDELLVKIPTRNAEAYINYQKGQELLKRGGGNMHELDAAVELFQLAIELDPGFSLAYVGLSDAYLEYIFWGRLPSSKVLPMALDAAFKAFELDDEKVEIYAALGAINFYRYEVKKAKYYLEKAIELSPNYHPPYEWLAWINIFENNNETAIKLFEKAHELEPLSTKYLGDQGLSFYYLKLYKKGIKYNTESLQKYPEDNYLLWVQGLLLIAQEKYTEAIEVFKTRSSGTNTNWLLGYAYAMNGNNTEAERILNLLLKKRKTQHIPAFMIAILYMGLDDKKSTLDWLEVDWEEGSQGLMFWGMKSDIRFDPIKDEPRFQALLDKVKFVE
jgi:adenylate cyclase